MAVLAFQSKVTDVDVWLGVAVHALRGGIYIASVSVAILTGDLNMLSLQGEAVFVVKTTHAVNPIVAIQTGGAILTLVFLNKTWVCLALLMAGNALVSLESIDVNRVARPAGDRLTAIIHLVMCQAETGLCEMIEGLAFQRRWGPRKRVVAHVAALGEDTGMQFGLLVAGCALAGGLAENLQNVLLVYGMLAGRPYLCVAGAARDLCMPAV